MTERVRPPHWQSWLAGASIVFLMLLAGVGTREAPSFWRHLATGRHILQSGLADHDPFTVLGASRPWSNPSWLFDSLAYMAYLAGEPALIGIRCVLIAILGVLLAGPLRGVSGCNGYLPALLAVP